MIGIRGATTGWGCPDPSNFCSGSFPTSRATCSSAADATVQQCWSWEKFLWSPTAEVLPAKLDGSCQAQPSCSTACASGNDRWHWSSCRRTWFYPSVNLIPGWPRLDSSLKCWTVHWHGTGWTPNFETMVAPLIGMFNIFVYQYFYQMTFL